MITRRSAFGWLVVIWLAVAGLANANLFQAPFATGPGSGYAFITSTQFDSGGTGGTAPAIDTLTDPANLIVITMTGVSGFEPAGGAASFTDSQSNAYSQCHYFANSYGSWVGIYYKYAPSNSATLAVTNNTSFNTFAVAAFKGAAASPCDQSNHNESPTPVNSITTGSVTPTTNGQLVVAACAVYTTLFTPTVDTPGFLTPQTVAYVGGTHLANCLAYAIQGTATATNPNVVWIGATDQASAAVATFK